MKILENQIIYQCEYCDKKNLSKKGSEIHENEYCRNENSPHKKDIIKKQEECKHENFYTVWRYIPGEAVQEPDYDICIDCDKVL